VISSKWAVKARGRSEVSLQDYAFDEADEEITHEIFDDGKCQVDPEPSQQSHLGNIKEWESIGIKDDDP